jgi:site-specific recombinase XerD
MARKAFRYASLRWTTSRLCPQLQTFRRRRLVALRSFLRYCAREDWTPGDLGVTIDLPKLPRRRPKPLTDPELDRMTSPTAAGSI